MIICAALKVINPNAPIGFDETVVPCLRHGDGFSMLRSLYPEKLLHRGAVQGFIDHNGNFLTREEAYEHALLCGQLSAELRNIKSVRGDKELYSEDLY